MELILFYIFVFIIYYHIFSQSLAVVLNWKELTSELIVSLFFIIRWQVHEALDIVDLMRQSGLEVSNKTLQPLLHASERNFDLDLVNFNTLLVILLFLFSYSLTWRC